MINILEDSQKAGCGGIFIATDSAKAYDYVDERYICEVLEKFGFPKAFINTIRQLFFSERYHRQYELFPIRTGTTIAQTKARGFLSPILLNLALEPLLLAILNDNDVLGYSLCDRVSNPSVHITLSQPIKLLTYADNLLVFVNDKVELEKKIKCILHVMLKFITRVLTTISLLLSTSQLRRLLFLKSSADISPNFSFNGTIPQTLLVFGI